MVAFLFTDIVGSTQRWEQRPDAMRAALKRHDSILRDAILSEGGTVFRTLGDSFMAAFGSPQEAARAALKGQSGLAAHDFASVGGLQVRMAVYAGIVEARDQDFFGQAANRTQRLLTACHGGQTLIAGVAAEMVAARPPPGLHLIDLGRHRLRDLPHPEHVWQIVGTSLRRDFPPILSQGGAGNLPRPLTSFVGREGDLREVERRLRASRLVTIVGSGGVGKTRLSVEVAGRARNFQDGAWFVELAGVSDARRLPQTIAAALGAPCSSDARALDEITQYLRGRQCLILLDNCEHVLSAAAEAAARILRGAIGPSVLATSREPLGAPGEDVVRVDGLPAPPADAEIGAAAAMGYGSVRLFVERARAASGYELTEVDVAAVCDICRKLDGVPLALELASARLKMMGAPHLAERIGARFELLTGGERSAQTRQRTLAALYEWSHVLLEPEEKKLFRRAAAFAGGTTLSLLSDTLAEAGAPVAPPQLFDLVGSLVDKSLINVDRGGGEPRYRMIETTRDFAWRKLAEAGETAFADAMARVLRRRLEALDAEWSHAPTEAWLAEVAPDLDNLRFALQWCFDEPARWALGCALLAASLRLWEETSLFEERRRWASTALSRLPEDADDRLAARLWMASLSQVAHGDRGNHEPARRAAVLFAAADDQWGLAEAKARAGAALLTPSNVAQAEADLRAAHALLAIVAPLSKQMASCLRSCGLARAFAGDMGAARPLLEASRDMSLRLGDERGLVSSDITLAELCFAERDPERAIAIARRILDARKPNRRQYAVAMGNLTAYLFCLSRYEESRFTLLLAIGEARAIGHQSCVARLAEVAAGLAAATGDGAGAARLLGYAEAFYAKGAASREYTEERVLTLAVELLSAAEPNVRRDMERQEGRGWSHEQAAAAARAICLTPARNLAPAAG
jgi:predicted ATPase/class 3 adenylate cyclase